MSLKVEVLLFGALRDTLFNQQKSFANAEFNLTSLLAM
jgi:hypothetical protein